MLRAARDLDLLTIGYAFNAEDTVRLMEEAAPDIFIFHAGITAGGTTGDAGAASLARNRRAKRAALRSCAKNSAGCDPACSRRGDRRPRARAAHARPYRLPWHPAWLERRAARGRRTAGGASRRVQSYAACRRTRLRPAEMPLVAFRDLMADAARCRYAVGYFESFSLESLLAVDRRGGSGTLSGDPRLQRYLSAASGPAGARPARPVRRNGSGRLPGSHRSCLPALQRVPASRLGRSGDRAGLQPGDVQRRCARR